LSIKKWEKKAAESSLSKILINEKAVFRQPFLANTINVCDAVCDVASSATKHKNIDSQHIRVLPMNSASLPSPLRCRHTRHPWAVVRRQLMRPCVADIPAIRGGNKIGIISTILSRKDKYNRTKL